MVNCSVVDNGSGSRYAVCLRGERPLGSEQDAVELVGFCVEARVSLLLLEADALSPEFFDLRTGLAGMMLQKFVVYGIKTALVMPDSARRTGRFAELVTEANRGPHFRVFTTRDQAEAWLVG